MTISPQQISSLRQRTGVGMMAVKKALEESNGDEEQAIELLRKRGEAQVVKRGERDQKEGIVFTASTSTKAALVLLACETDFVARGDDFLTAGKAFATQALNEGEDAVKTAAETTIPALVNKLGENISIADIQIMESDNLGFYLHSNNKIGVLVSLDGGTPEQAKDTAMHAAAMAPAVISPDEVPTELVEKEKEIWKDQLKEQGKSEEIWDKIMTGKEKKFREESALIKQAFVKDPQQTVEQYLDGAKVTEYVRVAA